jgi:hypothetical protein
VENCGPPSSSSRDRCHQHQGRPVGEGWISPHGDLNFVHRNEQARRQCLPIKQEGAQGACAIRRQLLQGKPQGLLQSSALLAFHTLPGLARGNPELRREEGVRLL